MQFKYVIKTAVIMIFPLIMSFHGYAADGYDLELAKIDSERLGIAFFPVIAYMPETSWLFGGAAVLYLKPANGAGEVKTDSLTICSVYSLKKQYRISGDGEIYVFNDALHYRFHISGTRYPTDYYGIGPDTPSSEKEGYTPVYVPFENSILLRIVKNFYAGPSFDYRHTIIKKTESGETLESGEITGSRTMNVSGAGAIIIYDTRDSEMSPHRGFYSEIEALHYSKAIGSDSRFGRDGINFKWYVPFGPTTLSIQVYGAAVYGDPPFYYIPSIGGAGQYNMRGFLDGRHIDRRLVLSQVEYRFPLVWRFGMTVFAGAGEVAPAIRDFGEHPRAACGTGLRLMIDKREKINMRCDVSYNGQDPYFYINILEAF